VLQRITTYNVQTARAPVSATSEGNGMKRMTRMLTTLAGAALLSAAPFTATAPAANAQDYFGFPEQENAPPESALSIL
jgi:hypothetical protein